MQGIRRGRDRNRKASTIMVLAVGLIFLAGAAVFLYPAVSNWLAEIHQSDVIQKYEDTVADADSNVYAEAWRLAQEYNENLAGDPVHDPFVPGSGYALPENYLECLNLDGSGVMGYIEIPGIAVCLPIYHGTSDDVLEKGVGHVESTALPIGGDFTHAVLTGHRGLPNAKLFTDLDQLEPGDQFYIHVLDQVLAYEVDIIHTVLPDELEELRPVEGRDLVTLVTCTPYGVNTHRLLVRGTRIPYIPEEAEAYRQNADFISGSGAEKRLQYLGMAVGIFILLVIIIAFFMRRKGGRHEANK